VDQDEDEGVKQSRDDADRPDAAVNPALALWLLGEHLDEYSREPSGDR
jgi:hypothetical protein